MCIRDSYCIGFYEKYNSVSNFRVDRMEDVEVSDEPAIKMCIRDRGKDA